MKILLATGNPHKFAELSAILPRQTQSGEPLIYVSLADIKGLTLPEETGTTLEENAQLKARYAAQKSGLPAISDDTGLEVDALQGRPGVHTARYAGPQADTAANNCKILAELQGLPLDKRSARFRTVACLVYPDGRTLSWEGKLEGYITLDYQGTNGFGYDPLFLVQGTHQTLAQMTPEIKNQISHRARAFAQLAAYLTSSTQKSQA